MRRRIRALACVVVAGLVLSGCSLFDEVHGRYRMDIGATSPSSPWLATWTAEPTPPDQELLAGAKPKCLDLAGDTALRGHVVLTDQRGPDAVAILWSAGDETMYCLVARTDGNVHSHILGGFTTDPGAGGNLTITDSVCGTPTLVTGFVPAGTETLVIETEGGLEVTASVADGRFLAWWPGPDRPVALGSAAHEHGEEVLGHPSCDHYLGTELGHIHQAISVIDDAWMQPGPIGCGELRCAS